MKNVKTRYFRIKDGDIWALRADGKEKCLLSVIGEAHIWTIDLMDWYDPKEKNITGILDLVKKYPKDWIEISEKEAFVEIL